MASSRARIEAQDRVYRFFGALGFLLAAVTLTEMAIGPEGMLLFLTYGAFLVVPAMLLISLLVAFAAVALVTPFLAVRGDGRRPVQLGLAAVTVAVVFLIANAIFAFAPAVLLDGRVVEAVLLLHAGVCLSTSIWWFTRGRESLARSRRG